MTERQKLSLNRPRKASQEEQPQNNSVYRKKVWVNAAPKNKAKKPKPQKVVKPQPKKVEKPKQEVKVKIPKPPTPPKKRLPLEEAISQISAFWPNLFTEHQLRPCLGSIGYHADYRALIQLGAFRYDKDGQIVGEINQADVEDNLQRLVRRNKDR